MKRIISLAIAGALVAALAAGGAIANGHRAKLQLRDTSVGRILVNGSGFTIYAFTKDHRNKDNCVKIQGCAAVWPPVTTSGKVAAGPGVKRSLIGTITLSGATKQVTYGGHPLYTYIGDSGPGQTFYVNFFQFGGNWPAVNASGHEVK